MDINELIEKAENGDAVAQNKLGYCYRNGIGVEKDNIKAVYWYEKAATQGNASAQNNLGYCYQEGLGVEQNYEEAVFWYKKAVTQGNASAQNNLGYCYQEGLGVKQDYEESVKLYRKVAIAGNANAQYNLGYCYQKGLGVKRDYEKAIEWYKKAAIQGNASAQNNLGYCYQNGLGVRRNYKIAVELYKKAAMAGNTEAQNNLGHCYEKGWGGEQDFKEAAKLYKKAALGGNASAQSSLGYCYQEGLGVEQNYEEAVFWYKKAAMQGYAAAQNNLGYCYQEGLGVKQDYEQAIEWYEKAANNGIEKHYLGTILKKMNGREIKTIRDVSELPVDMIDENKIGAIKISPEANKYSYSHSLYSISDYKKCRTKIDEILEDIDEVNESKNNELEVFMQIYVKLAKMISYDEEAVGNKDKTNLYTSYTARNIIGGLLQEKCVCAGYTEILRNVLACRGIECRYVFSLEHAYNQVKINGNWYYVDLTADRDRICKGEELSWCLLSESEFNIIKEHKNSPGEVTDESTSSYPHEELNQVYKKILEAYGNKDEKTVELKEEYNNLSFTELLQVASKEPTTQRVESYEVANNVDDMQQD